MKLAILLLAIVGLSNASSNDTTHSVFKDILDSIPIRDLIDRSKWYDDTNVGFQHLKKYMHADEWVRLVTALRAHPEWNEIKKWMILKGIDLKEMFRSAQNWIDQSRLLTKYLTEMKMIFPNLRAALDEKVRNNPLIMELIEKLKGKNVYEFVEEMRQNEEVLYIIRELKLKGLHLDGVVQALYNSLGWSYKTPETTPVKTV